MLRSERLEMLTFWGIIVFLFVPTLSDHIPWMINGRPKGGFLGVPKVANSHLISDAEPQWFDQRLTHFDDANLATWKQRYFVNAEYFRASGPVFLMIGGEGPLSPKWVAVGSMVDYAKQHGALILALEHRFYGESHPLSDMSTENLRYLSSEQALADLAAFRQAMVVQFSLDVTNRWIVFGGSYPGALAAWFRYKYPHLAYGAVASSAPINAQLDFPQYLEVATSSLGTNWCQQDVNTATNKLEQFTKTEAGLKYLSSKFRTCKPLTANKLDLQSFASAMAGNFFGVIQYNKDNREFEGAVGTNITIATLCGIMNDTNLGDEIDRYAAINNLMMDTYGQECIDISYESFIASMRETDWSSSAAEGGRQWFYQTCTEFGYYQTTDSLYQDFGTMFPLSYSIQQCIDIFGISFNATSINRGINWTNNNYGSYSMDGERIVFPNGSIDPWHALSFTKDHGEIIAVYIQGTAHCANMYPSSSDDSAELQEARQRISDIITKWLAQP